MDTITTHPITQSITGQPIMLFVVIAVIASLIYAYRIRKASMSTIFSGLCSNAICIALIVGILRCIDKTHIDIIWGIVIICILSQCCSALT